MEANYGRPSEGDARGAAKGGAAAMTAEKSERELGGSAEGEARDAPESFWAKHGNDVILALLFVYVILLGIGTVAELFHIESVLSWPIYR